MSILLTAKKFFATSPITAHAKYVHNLSSTHKYEQKSKARDCEQVELTRKYGIPSTVVQNSKVTIIDIIAKLV